MEIPDLIFPSYCPTNALLFFSRSLAVVVVSFAEIPFASIPQSALVKLLNRLRAPAFLKITLAPNPK